MTKVAKTMGKYPTLLAKISFCTKLAKAPTRAIAVVKHATVTVILTKIPPKDPNTLTAI
jgi:hypothetical protein